MFHSKPSGSFRPYFNASEVIKEFLRQHKSIDFILMFSSGHINSSRLRVNSRMPFRKVKVELFPNVNFTKIPSSIRNSLAELKKYFPEPVNIAHGARETIRHGFDPKKFIILMEGFSISEREIKLSANDVLGRF